MISKNLPVSQDLATTGGHMGPEIGTGMVVTQYDLLAFFLIPRTLSDLFFRSFSCFLDFCTFSYKPACTTQLH